jgi:hypothetical protein
MTSAFSKEVEVIIANCSNSYHFVIREIPQSGGQIVCAGIWDTISTSALYGLFVELIATVLSSAMCALDPRGSNFTRANRRATDGNSKPTQDRDTAKNRT